MTWQLKFVTLIIVIALISSATYSIYSVYTENRKLNQQNQSLTTQLSEQTAINAKQQESIQALHELEAKHIQELNHAKTEINTLRADVAAGRRRLQITATCPVSETVTTGGVGDAETPQLTEPARQDYFRLREMMAENERQTRYLQDYINIECRGNNGKSTP
ncbi:lysis protein [Xenorhabdus sp. BG5]|uniref:lysis protein n=1 Tax=Xenorhabdus sp. BG5 TaxID=2782014 RepID=UPI00187EAC07|nr:lysis protein [Xenorhabdus sp. BG5]MBE8597405.1 lysis protein [Xenorhabdus sp. BG5]